MKTNTYNGFVIKQGATFNYVLTWYGDKNKTTPINLTGYTARMHVRTNIEDATPILELTTENGRITLGGALGTITLLVSAADTAALSAGSAVYDLELISGSVVKRIIEGSLVITREVTR